MPASSGTGKRCSQLLSWAPIFLTFLLATAVGVAVITGLRLNDATSSAGGEECARSSSESDSPASIEVEEDPLDRYVHFLPRKARPRRPVLIGVMTTAKFIDTRALAAYRTWGQDVRDLIFFSSEGTRSRHGLPLVALRSIDDSYPPQRKSFAMLQYMNKHFGDDYEFFLRLDDDVYVRKERLLRMVAYLGRGANVYLGQPGQGRGSEDLGLELKKYGKAFDRYCMGGPGVLISRSVLRAVAPNVDYCIQYLLRTNHEDVEVGRCIWHFTRVPCTQNAEVNNMCTHTCTHYIDKHPMYTQRTHHWYAGTCTKVMVTLAQNAEVNNMCTHACAHYIDKIANRYGAPRPPMTDVGTETAFRLDQRKHFQKSKHPLRSEVS